MVSVFIFFWDQNDAFDLVDVSALMDSSHYQLIEMIRDSEPRTNRLLEIFKEMILDSKDSPKEIYLVECDDVNDKVFWKNFWQKDKLGLLDLVRKNGLMIHNNIRKDWYESKSR